VSENAPLVYVVVLNYRNYWDTITCVERFEKLHYANYRVVIVDNDSDNESEAELRRLLPKHHFIQSGSNLGYAAGNNVGIRFAQDNGADYVLIANSDLIVDPACLGLLIDYAEANPSVGLLSPLVTRSNGKASQNCTRSRPTLFELLWNYGIGDDRDRGMDDIEQPVDVEVIWGACMLLSRRLLDTVGLLDEGTFLFWEEFILHEKIRASGMRTVLVPDARASHEGSASTKTIGHRANYENWRSLNYYLKNYRHFGWLARVAIMVSAAIRQLLPLVKTLTGLRRIENSAAAPKRPAP
jgi:GT2 family glycosyltransferase